MCVCVCARVHTRYTHMTRSVASVHNSLGGSWPGSSVHGILRVCVCEVTLVVSDSLRPYVL